MLSIKKRKKPVNMEEIIASGNKSRKRIKGKSKGVKSKVCSLCGGNMVFMPDSKEYFCLNCGNDE